MDLESFKKSIVVKAHHLFEETKVPLHKHHDFDELFYCFRGSGIGVVGNEEVEVTAGKTLLAPSGTMHTLKTTEDLYVLAFEIPLVK